MTLTTSATPRAVPARTQPRRGSRALRSAAKTVRYEFDMFLLASRCLRESKGQPEESLFLEALLLHTRVLRDFFLAVRRWDDDVLVTDFLRTKPRFKLRHLRAPATKRRLDKLLAHASFTRPRLGKKWPVGTIQQEVVQAWMLFMRELEKENPKARAWFPEYIVKSAPLA